MLSSYNKLPPQLPNYDGRNRILASDQQKFSFVENGSQDLSLEQESHADGISKNLTNQTTCQCHTKIIDRMSALKNADLQIVSQITFLQQLRNVSPL